MVPVSSAPFSRLSTSCQCGGETTTGADCALINTTPKYSGGADWIKKGAPECFGLVVWTEKGTPEYPAGIVLTERGTPEYSGVPLLVVGNFPQLSRLVVPGANATSLGCGRLRQRRYSFSSSHRYPAASRNSPKNHSACHGPATVSGAAPGAVAAWVSVGRCAAACWRVSNSGPGQAAAG